MRENNSDTIDIVRHIILDKREDADFFKFFSLTYSDDKNIEKKSLIRNLSFRKYILKV